MKTRSIRGRVWDVALHITNAKIPTHKNDILSDNHDTAYRQIMWGTRYIINENIFGVVRAPVPARGLEQIAKKYRE